MRAAETHRHAKALRRTDANVSAKFTRGLQNGQRKQVGSDDCHRARRFGLGEKLREVVDAAAGVGILHQHGEKPVARSEIESLPIARDHLDAQRLGAGHDHVDRLRVAAVGYENRLALRLASEGQAHRLGGGRAFVEQ